MAQTIDSIVSVNITKNTIFPTRAGFGIPLIMGENTIQSIGEINTFNSLQEVLDKGFSTTDEAYLSAKAMLSQNPSVKTFKIARKESISAQVDTVTVDTLIGGNDYVLSLDGTDYLYNSVASQALVNTVTVDTLTPNTSYNLTLDATPYSYSSLANIAQVNTFTVNTITNNYLYRVTLEGVDFDFTSDADATDQEIVDGVVALIDADPLYNAVGVDALNLTVTAVTAGTPFTVANIPELTMVETTPNQIEDTIEDVVDGLVALTYPAIYTVVKASASTITVTAATAGVSYTIAVTAEMSIVEDVINVIGDTIENIVDSLVSAADLNPNFNVLKSGIDTSVFTVSHITVNVPFTTAVSTEMSFVNTNPASSETMAEAILRADANDSEWYFMLITSRDSADILEAASTIETLTKIFLFESDDADSKDLESGTDVTSLAAILMGFSYERTAMMWSGTANLDGKSASAWVGDMSPRLPGGATWKFKNLSGVQPDKLTTTEVTNIKNKNCNVYTTVAGIAIAAEGVLSGGEFIDIIRGTDKLQARIQENVYGALAQEPKIPYTNQGGNVLGNQVKAALTEMELDGLLSIGTSVVTVPKVEDIPPAERASREFGEITFTSIYAGAVHKVNVVGTISI